MGSCISPSIDAIASETRPLRKSKRAKHQDVIPSPPPPSRVEEKESLDRMTCSEGTGNASRSQQPLLPTSVLLEALPEGVLTYNVLSQLNPSDLCNMLAVCKRTQTLVEANDAHLWGRIVHECWPDCGATATGGLVDEACTVAGSFRAYALQKQLSTRPLGLGDGWKGPCEYELQASLARILSIVQQGTRSGNHVLFLLDGSGSVGDEEFEASTSFIARATNVLKSQTDHQCRVAVAQFSNDVRTEWEDAPGSVTDPAAFEATIKSMVRINGGTNIAAAITHAGKMLKKHATTEEDVSSAKVIIFITDGRVDGYQAKEARQVSAMLADELSNTAMFAFGVGRGVDRAEMMAIIEPARGPAGGKYRAAEARYLDLFYKDEAPW